MEILHLDKVVKQYHNHKALDEVSFSVPKGSIFGLLGPNGAGKTSLIRIITGITMADSGEIYIEGNKIKPSHQEEIGYMPEERGLYKKMKVVEQLMYLAQLKGMSRNDAMNKLKFWMDKFDILSWKDKRIEELSKGMQQKIQFIATIIHDPKLLILDEPFSGLDPINSNLIKDEIAALNANGTSIIFSTHRMEQVEEICKNIVLINKGKNILQGSVQDIKHNFKENKYKIGYNGTLPNDLHSEFKIDLEAEHELTVTVQDHIHPNQMLMSLLNAGVEIRSYNEILPSLNEIFIKKVGNSEE